MTTFASARYEIFVASVFVKAGFDIEFEDETDPQSRHPEFIATHKKTGFKVAVEAKQRQRTQRILEKDMEGDVRIGITHLLKDAAGKYNGLPYVVFADIDCPPLAGNVFEKPWAKELLDAPDTAGFRESDGRDRFNMVIYTNRPIDYTLEVPSADSHIVAVSLVPKHPLPQEVVNAIHSGVKLHGNIPNTFEE